MAGEKKQINVQELEAEFGLEGNTSAAESDAVVAAAEGRDPDQDTGQDQRTIDVDTIESTIKREEALRDLDDNLERMDKEAELDAEEEGDEGDADDVVADDADDGDEDEEEGAEEGGEESAEAGDQEEEAEGEGEEEGEGAEEGEGDEELDPMRAWIREQLPEDEDRAELFQALMDEGVEIEYTANGQTVRESMQAVLRKAAGYAGEEEVTRRSQAAKRTLAEAEALQKRAEEAEEKAQLTVQTVTKQIDDPEVFGEFLTSRGSLEYLQALHSKLEATLAEAESNPQGFHMNRRLAGIENALQTIMNGGASPAGDTRESREAEGRRDTEEGSALDPSQIPDDLGFIRGEGYPSQYAIIAKREVTRALEAATAAGAEVRYEDVVKRWAEEGKTRPILDVAKGLIQGTTRDRQKRKLGERPPNRRTPKGRGKSGKKSGSGSKREKAVAWDDIPGRVVKELQAAQASSELES